jgi:NAD+ synthase (glutamine-hydrolysing)
MRLINVGMASINATVGNFSSNVDRIIEMAQQLSAKECAVVCFPEQTISGYPCEDLVQWSGFVEEQFVQLERFCSWTQSYHNTNTVFVVGVTINHDESIYNCAAVVYRGRIWGIVPKQKLPTYNVFYEARTFSAGWPGQFNLYKGIPFGDLIFKFPFGTMAVEICEDIWSPDGPMKNRAYAGAELIVNISASPWRYGVVETRREMIATRASDNQATVVYVNQYGGQDSLVFDGGGFICQNGRILAEGERWSETSTVQTVALDITSTSRRSNTTWRTDCQKFLIQSKAQSPQVVEIKDGPGFLPESKLMKTSGKAEAKNPFIPQDSKTETESEFFYSELIEAMITGLAGYFEKTGAFSRIVISLSGGKDSYLTLFIAWLYAYRRFNRLLPDPEECKNAIADFIWCFSMPTRFNSSNTKTISAEVCQELFVYFRELSIDEDSIRESRVIFNMIGGREELNSITLQNIQARIRGSRMWNIANACGGLWLQTGNMSEKAVGYTTIGGDLMGGYSLIGNLPKTVVIGLLHYIASKYGDMFTSGSIQKLLESKASAELAENQEDERDLMPFEILDNCFLMFAGKKMMPKEIYLELRRMFSDDDLRALYPGYEPDMLKKWVIRFSQLFLNSIFKWVQAPQSVHLGSLDLDRERALQLPVVQSKSWLELDELGEYPD